MSSWGGAATRFVGILVIGHDKKSARKKYGYQESFATNNRSKTRFIINLFGESGMGKTTVLRQLIEMLRVRAQYNIEVGDGFKTQDLRSIMWYRIGQSPAGVVCVCTKGDNPGIIKENVRFFNDHFQVLKSKGSWTSWVPDEFKNAMSQGSPIGVLVTASRKPFIKGNKKSEDSLEGFDILNIPIQLDIWPNPEEERQIGTWRTAVRSPSELVLVHINYLLRNAMFKPIPKKIFDFKSLRAGVSRD